MKTKKIVNILLVVLVIAAFAVVPVFAQGVNPPVESKPAFDLAYISQLLQALVLATLPVLAGMGAKWLSAKASVEKAKLSAEQTYALDLFIKTAVYAAQQMKAAGFVNDKLKHATDLVEAWLIAHGVEMDIAEIRARIEAMIKQEFNMPVLK